MRPGQQSGKTLGELGLARAADAGQDDKAFGLQGGVELSDLGG